jgi:hypothetical protein
MCQRVVRISGHDNAAKAPARLVSAEQPSHLAPPRCALYIARSITNAEPHVPQRVVRISEHDYATMGPERLVSAERDGYFVRVSLASP